MLDTVHADTAPPKAIDIGTMSWDALIKSPDIPQNFKDRILLQLQRDGKNGAYIGISDFGRLGVDEEIELNRKKREELLNKATSFATQKAEFIEILQEQRTKTSEEIDEVNDLIKDVPEDSEAGIGLRRYRDLLRDYYEGLGWFIKKTKSATTTTALNTLMNGFGATYQFVMRNRHVMLGALQVSLRGLGAGLGAAGQGLGNLLRFIPLPF